MKKLFLLLIITLAINCKSFAQIYFNNKYTEPVWVCIGYYSDGNNFKGWVSKGWFKIEPNETKMVLDYNPLSRYLYYYAQTQNGIKKFEGSQSFLVDPINSFLIKNADMKYVKTNNPNFKWHSFRQVDKGLKDLAKLKYTISFSY